MVLPQSPQKEEMLVSLLDQLGAAGRSGEILGDVDTQELEAVHTLHRRPVWVSVPPEVHDELLGLLSVEQQVVGVAPLSQTIHLLPVGGLIVVFDEANHRGVVCKLNDGIGTIDRFAVMGEEGVEESRAATNDYFNSRLITDYFFRLVD